MRRSSSMLSLCHTTYVAQRPSLFSSCFADSALSLVFFSSLRLPSFLTAFSLGIFRPPQLGEVQKAFHIHAEGSFTLQVKNPDGDHSNSVVRQQPEAKQPKVRLSFIILLPAPTHLVTLQMPAELKKLFNGLKWTPCDPPTFLDYPGTELLVIPSSHTPAQDIGEDAGKELEKEREDVEKAVKAEEGDDEAQKALKEVGLEGLMNGKGLEGHWE